MPSEVMSCWTWFSISYAREIPNQVRDDGSSRPWMTVAAGPEWHGEAKRSDVMLTPALGCLGEMKKKIIIFLLLIFSLFIPFLGFEIVNTNSFSEFKNFYSFFWIGFSYIILLLISAILILKSKNKLFYRISFILIDCVYIFFTVFLIKILIP